MLEITIKNAETGTVLHRTTNLMTICAHGEKNVYSMILGTGTFKDIATLAGAMDNLRDTMLNQDDQAKALYRLRDMFGKEKIVSSEMVELFDEG